MNSLSKMFLRGRTSLWACLLVTLLAVLNSGRMMAQGYGSIVGTVTDATGAVVAGATVTATQTSTGRQTMVKTGQAGSFVFPTLLPSGYSVSIAAGGFETYNQSDIALQAD